ncbi:MAG: hypothetical protein EHM28_11385 [Spirochaetaceae bacterium]|nr:MAG: hypothetical protein EHM28_11385 [Spirochaetaceae bacterium]
MKAICPYCEKPANLKMVKSREEYEIKGMKVTVNVEKFVCMACKRDFATKEQMEKATIAGYAAYRKKVDIISPKEIIHIREKYGTSQKVMAKILDLGELTINSYEQGALVSKSISNLIRLMENPHNFIILFNKKRHELSHTQIRRIESALRDQKVTVVEV